MCRNLIGNLITFCRNLTVFLFLNIENASKFSQNLTLKIRRKLQKHLTRVRFELDSKDKHPSLTQSWTKPRHEAADRTADRDALMAEVAAVQAELAALADADEAVLEGLLPMFVLTLS